MPRQGEQKERNRDKTAFRCQVEEESLVRSLRRSRSGVGRTTSSVQSSSVLPWVWGARIPQAEGKRIAQQTELRQAWPSFQDTNAREGPTAPGPTPGHSAPCTTHPPPRRSLKCLLHALWIRLTVLDTASEAPQDLALMTSLSRISPHSS